jgi:hypothetical protein
MQNLFRIFFGSLPVLRTNCHMKTPGPHQGDWAILQGIIEQIWDHNRSSEAEV